MKRGTHGGRNAHSHNCLDTGPIAYLLTLIENAASGSWRENCKQYEGPGP
jgi:hypothetical protein